MIEAPKFRGLNEPKITPMTKEQYRKFHLVRNLNSPSLGDHQLLSFNQKKYIGKELPAALQFRTSRPPNSQIFHYAENATNFYIFSLPGEPLSNMLRHRSGHQIKRWVQKCGDEEDAFMELIQFCLKLYEEMGVQDLLMECFRVSQDQLIYAYDSWMLGTPAIVAKDQMQIQNYFLCENDLKKLQKNSMQETTYGDFFFKLGLMILNLGVPEVKIRNYEYGQFTLNTANIEEKLRLFQIKYCRKNIASLLDQLIHYKVKTIKDLSHLFDNGKSRACFDRALKPSSVPKSSINKENAPVSSAMKKSHLLLNQSMNGSIVDCSRQSRRVKLKSRNMSNLSESFADSLFNTNSCAPQPPESIELKALLSNLKQHQPFMQMIDYLGLGEYLPRCAYEEKILEVFAGVHIKNEWRHKVYPNGSVYWGEFEGDKREGEGLYLFDSHDFYYGQWQNNFMNGKGTYVFKSGESYQGQLVKGVKEGFGQFNYKDGRVFEGSWVHNNKVGLGSLTFPDGVKFTGFFQKNCETEGIFTKVADEEIIQCFGILESYNWQMGQFTGEQDPNRKNKLKKCRLDAFKSCLDKQGDSYEGECSNDQPNGFGIMETPTEVFEGHWANGKESGVGVLKVKNRFVLEGVWEEGMMIEYRQ